MPDERKPDLEPAAEQIRDDLSAGGGLRIDADETSAIAAYSTAISAKRQADALERIAKVLEMGRGFGHSGARPIHVVNHGR